VDSKVSIVSIGILNETGVIGQMCAFFGDTVFKKATAVAAIVMIRPVHPWREATKRSSHVQSFGLEARHSSRYKARCAPTG
jgi:hypothetical protein